MPSSESKNKEPKKLPGIFISYRRSDAPDAVGRIYDRLVSEFGKARVFKDVDSIPLGQDFRSHLNDIVGGCAAVLAIVGPRWVDTRNASGQRRLEDPDDFVRIELEAALARNVPVVPVLVGHAPMPGSSELPTSLASMAFRQSIDVRPDPDFHNDATRLVTALRAIIDPNATPVSEPSPPANVRTSAMPWMWPAAFAVAAFAAAMLAVPALRHLGQTPPTEIRTEISAGTQANAGGGMALSPDGKQIAFVAMRDGESRLWLRPLATTDAQLLPGTEGASLPFWSPDSRSIGFFTSSALKRLDLGGGAAMTLTQLSGGIGGAWNAEGVILFSQGIGKPLARIAATGGAVTEVTRLEAGAVGHLFPKFLPDGHRFLFSQVGPEAGTYLATLVGGTPVKLTSAVGETAHLPSGWLLIWQDQHGVLIAQRLDTEKAALVGAPVTLAEGRGMVSASTNGLMAYWKRAFEGDERQLKWRSRSGAELGTIGPPDRTYFAPRISPDGRRVAVERGESAKADIWLLDGERAVRATFGAEGDGFPLWSPDGAAIVFAAIRSGASGLYKKPADGAGEEELLLAVESTAVAPSGWSRDGRSLAYVYLGKETLLDVGVLPMTGDRKPSTYLDSKHQEGGAEFSPDGKWVVYQSNESNRPEIYIRPFIVPVAGGAASATRGGKWQVSTAGGAYPKWSPDDKEVYFINPLGELMAAPIVVTGSALMPGTPVKLFQMGIVGGGTDTQQGPQYDVARDGRFLINTVVRAEGIEAPPIILIQNWNPSAR